METKKLRCHIQLHKCKDYYFLFYSILGLRILVHRADTLAHHTLLFPCCSLRQPDHSWLQTQHESIYLHLACQAASLCAADMTVTLQ